MAASVPRRGVRYFSSTRRGSRWRSRRAGWQATRTRTIGMICDRKCRAFAQHARHERASAGPASHARGWRAAPAGGRVWSWAAAWLAQRAGRPRAHRGGSLRRRYLRLILFQPWASGAVRRQTGVDGLMGIAAAFSWTPGSWDKTEARVALAVLSPYVQACFGQASFACPEGPGYKLDS